MLTWKTISSSNLETVDKVLYDFLTSNFISITCNGGLTDCMTRTFHYRLNLYLYGDKSSKHLESTLRFIYSKALPAMITNVLIKDKVATKESVETFINEMKSKIESFTTESEFRIELSNKLIESLTFDSKINIGKYTKQQVDEMLQRIKDSVHDDEEFRIWEE